MNICVITGASSGLGREFFRAVLKDRPEIDEIWIIARRRERLEALAREASPKNVRVLALDVTNEEDISSYKSLLEELSPNVSLLINNAGAGKIGNVWELDYAYQGGTVSLNCRSMVEISAITIPYMSKGSQIINTCSIASFVPTPRMTVYSSTKAFVLSFSKGLRVELKKKGINCLAVYPCPMNTEFLEKGEITGKSKTFDALPNCDPVKVAHRSLKKSARGRGIYTPKALYKFYRVVAKLLPHGLVMKFSKL